MKKKLLNKNAYESVCRNCRHGRLSPEGDTVLCLKKGIVDPDGVCRRYSYDPLKRVPKKMPAVREADPADFDLSLGFEMPEKPVADTEEIFPAVVIKTEPAQEDDDPSTDWSKTSIFDDETENK